VRRRLGRQHRIVNVVRSRATGQRRIGAGPLVAATAGHPTLVGVIDDREARLMAESSPEIVELDPREAIAVRGEVPLADLPGFFERAFEEAAEAASASGVEIVGPPFGFYPEMPTETVTVEAGFPVSAPAGAHGDAHRLELPGGRAVQTTHVGPYDTLRDTYDRLASWMADQGLQPAVGMWESYLSDPRVEPDPATWRTRIIWPIT
jgi:effector-binding domain-containing protein